MPAKAVPPANKAAPADLAAPAASAAAAVAATGPDLSESRIIGSSDVQIPSLLHHVAEEAEKRLPKSLQTPLLLLRLSMLLQDTVDAARTCARACIEPPLLAKHLLGSDHQHLAGGESSVDEDAYAKTVLSTVGQVRRHVKLTLTGRARTSLHHHLMLASCSPQLRAVDITPLDITPLPTGPRREPRRCAAPSVLCCPRCSRPAPTSRSAGRGPWRCRQRVAHHLHRQR